MSILIDLPPTMVEQAREYATVQGTTLERMVFDYLTAELARKGLSSGSPLAEFVGCIPNKRRTDDVVSELRGYDQW